MVICTIIIFIQAVIQIRWNDTMPVDVIQRSIHILASFIFQLLISVFITSLMIIYNIMIIPPTEMQNGLNSAAAGRNNSIEEEEETSEPIEEKEDVSSFCCKLKCFRSPTIQVDGLACRKCFSFSYCKCICKSKNNGQNNIVVVKDTFSFYVLEMSGFFACCGNKCKIVHISQCIYQDCGECRKVICVCFKKDCKTPNYVMDSSVPKNDVFILYVLEVMGQQTRYITCCENICEIVDILECSYRDCKCSKLICTCFKKCKPPQ